MPNGAGFTSIINAHLFTGNSFQKRILNSYCLVCTLDYLPRINRIKIAVAAAVVLFANLKFLDFHCIAPY